MDTRLILESLERTDAVEDLLLTGAPLVGPGAVISNDLDWSTEFSKGRALFLRSDYESAAQTFRELDEALPQHDRILTPSKINESFCWLKFGEFDKYIEKYEPSMKGGRIYGLVLWKLAFAFHRTGDTVSAESCLRQWVRSPALQFLARGYLLISLLQVRNRKMDEAITHFNHAWRTDEDFCKRTIARYLGAEAGETLLEGVAPVEPLVKEEPSIVAKEEVISVLERLLIPRGLGKYPQARHQLSEFEYQAGYIAALERFGDGDVDEALRLIDSLLKGAQEKPVLLWAKAAYLAAKREWKDSIDLIEDQLDDPGIPGGVFWNAACAYLNLVDYPSALDTISRCTESEYRTSGVAWLTRGLLAHACGNIVIRNNSIREAIKTSPQQLVYYVGILKQIGADIEGLPKAEERVAGVSVEDEELVTRYEELVKITRRLLDSMEFSKRKLRLAEQFAQFAPASIADLIEVRDTTFRPILLPTCPAQLYDYKDVFLSGVDAFRRKAYEEAGEKFADLYTQTDRNYTVAVNLAVSLILSERYSRAVDVLLDAIERREVGGANAIRNFISALMRSGYLEEAFPWFSRLLKVSNEEYFNFVQMAYVAHLLGRKEDVATALYNACTVNLAEPSIRLKGAAVKACLEVKDNDRAFALLRYFAKEGPLPYVVAGATRPRVPAYQCKGYSVMKREHEYFRRRRDKRAALAYFGEVLQAREADYGALVDRGTVDELFNALRFYGESLFWNEELDRAHDALSQALGILVDHSGYYAPKQLSIRYHALTEIYFNREHYFWARELCERGLEADGDNRGLLRLHGQIKQRIGQIPERSREALRELAELPISRIKKAEDFLEVLPRVSQIVQPLSQDFPASREVVGDLVELINAVLGIETVPLVDRNQEISRLRGAANRIEGDLPLYLPKTSISALLPVLKGIRKALGEVQEKSICPEFTFTLEPASYYRENEASLVYKLRNTGRADMHKLQITMESETPHRWVPVLEEHSLDVVKKDELFWVDWPVHLEQPPETETEIRPKITLRFTGGSLRGEVVEQTVFDQDTKLLPFIDINVGYPVIALKPEEDNKLYGRENLLRILKNSFTSSGQTRIPFMEGVRKVGKTSIFYFLAARIGDNLLPVYVNLYTTWTNPFQLLAKCVSDAVALRIGVESGDVDRIATRDDFDRFLTNIIL